MLVYTIKIEFNYHLSRGENALLNSIKFIEFDPEILSFLCNILFENKKVFLKGESYILNLTYLFLCI